MSSLLGTGFAGKVVDTVNPLTRVSKWEVVRGLSYELSLGCNNELEFTLTTPTLDSTSAIWLCFF